MFSTHYCKRPSMYAACFTPYARWKKEDQKEKKINYGCSGSHLKWQQSPFLGEPGLRWGKRKPSEQLLRREWQPPPEPFCSSGSTFAHVHWLFQPLRSKSLYISFTPLLRLLLQQSSFRYLFSFLFSFHLYFHNSSDLTKILHACYQIAACTFTYTLSCFSPAQSFFGAGNTVSRGGEPHTFSALGTRVINMIYLPNVPVISLL